jgi:DegV family protein with EDD domain
MPRVAVITDSSACLPAELVARYGLRVVPLGLLIDDELFPDGALTPDELFARVDAARGRPQSTSPAPGEFLEAFQAARDEGADGALCLTLSAGYSGTHAAAVGAAEMAGEKLPGLPVRVVDTGGLAMTHGFAVLAAARAIGEGAGLTDAADIAQRVGSEGQLVGTLETMHYLVKGGRVPWIVGWAASRLGIRPVLAFERGNARSIARCRTTERAEERILDYLAHQAKHVPRAAVMHTGAPERAARLAGHVCERFRPEQLIVTEFTSVMAVHTGPGFVGIAISPDDD